MASRQTDSQSGRLLTSLCFVIGTVWGSGSFPWLACHGWLDNSGSFDTLAPLFPKDHRVICFDLPGNGISSHYPKGITYNHADLFLTFRRVAAHFGLKRYGILGHSMGGGVALPYTTLHPKEVVALIMLDVLRLRYRTPKDVKELTRRALDEFLATEDKLMSGRKPPTLSREEAKEKVLSSKLPTYLAPLASLTSLTSFTALNYFHGPDSMTPENCEILLERGMTRLPRRQKLEHERDHHMFTRDIRQNNLSYYGFERETLLNFVRNVKCPMLAIRTDRTPLHECDGEFVDTRYVLVRTYDRVQIAKSTIVCLTPELLLLFSGLSESMSWPQTRIFVLRRCPVPTMFT